MVMQMQLGKNLTGTYPKKGCMCDRFGPRQALLVDSIEINAIGNFLYTPALQLQTSIL